MSDYRLSIVKDLETELMDKCQVETISMISSALIKVLANYEVSERCTDLVPYDSVNERLLKQYCACCFVDGKSEKTVYQYKRSCQRFGDVLNKDFTQMGAYEIRYYLAMEKERGISDRTVENTRAHISAFFQWMTREDIIPKNPCANVKAVKYDDVVRKPFSDVEIDALRSACNTTKERALIEFLLSTGVRVSELVNMDVNDIDFQHYSIHVKHGKGGKQRITYISNIALKYYTEYLDNRKDYHIAVFQNHKHDRLSAGGIRFILNTIGKRANVSNVHPHRFRRTFASGLAARGMDIQEIKKLLGHSNINTTMKYVYTDDSKISASYRQYIA